MRQRVEASAFGPGDISTERSKAESASPTELVRFNLRAQKFQIRGGTLKLNRVRTCVFCWAIHRLRVSLRFSSSSMAFSLAQQRTAERLEHYVP